MSLTSVFTTGPVPDRLAPLLGDDPAVVGPYRLVGRIGAGGMGAVYAAADARGACVAVKVVHSEHAADPDYRARFAREADLLRRVRGSCTAAVLGSDTSGGTPWLATEYVPGPTLRERVRDGGPLSGGMLMGLAAGIAEGLVAVHAAGIVHRDLKPGNVILSPTGPKVLDFGIARSGDETAITTTGVLVGTPGWIPPELYQGAEPDARADMFAWGGLVAFAATGRNPYGTGSPDVLAFRVLDGRPDLEGVPDDLLPLVERAMAVDPAARPTAAEALAAVTALWGRRSGTGPGGADGAPTAVEEPATLTRLLDAEWTDIPPPPMARPGRGAPKALAVLAAAVSLALAAAGGYTAHTYLAEGRSWWAGTAGAGGDAGAHGDGAEDGAESAESGQGGEDGAGGGGDPAEDGGGQGGARSAVNGPSVTAVDGGDTFVTAEQGQVAWIVRMTGAAAEDGGVRFTAVAAYQGVRTAQLTAAQFAVTAGDRELPAGEEPLTGFLDAFQGTDTVSFLVPGAPPTGVLTLRGANHVEGGPGAPPMGLCYEVGAGFTADTEGCG
ncbi:serine/threonine protein kinase [Streptomonospora sp. S1-112]|uniref:Serine/threonine protein kinase n=1 Tax=Streptomonospora mangrovi TaxID=2883123 RepID=A0A9X3P0Y1_9ACTN|nr:serine/threonine-protein kinase [Streptomonospora mangrovi]MDA0567861.1 serine/threonine protein kinase [Streptomonospora mangrovi]